MREILFRGRSIKFRTWHEGELINTKGDIPPYMPMIVVTGLDGHSDATVIDVDPDTVGQYTGLTDKNGKRIFEGDIIKFKTRTSEFFTPLYVRWYEEDARFIVSLHDGIRSYPMDKSWEYEVIGNIHDNSELLEGVME